MYVVDVLVCKAVPATAALYQINVGVGKPLVDVTEAEGTALPHCAEFVAVGAVGNGLTVTVVVGAGDNVHPKAVMLAV